ncbi:ABC transporter substrate-binding protein [Aquincola tertiaricarbonis]|uniref:ABC transporter substrate-binding protein n=1 Tax=Aquincola tertiaricarbonis TaxID=391953 RepID=A0ABY4SAL7_AQUTE|nr:ABC transporter substrate-binding protein [Aquincola tertiaricarbonis]URI10402.1 ABC transporter substrate-binding protein [Aquincola tertiaricarbonis]
MRATLLLALCLGLLGPATALAQTAKVLRVAFNSAETGFDPARVSDLYSRTLIAHIFEAPLEYDPLARPPLLRPRTAQAMPEHSADYRTWTLKIRPGIHFAPDPAFGGQPRELVAQDYVYSFKRFADPVTASPVWSYLDSFGLVGLAELRERALQRQQPFDYEREIAGVRALDRYTLQFNLREPRPRFAYLLATSDVFGAVAREVVERYGNTIAEHPVGTGPFLLQQWRRSSRVVLARNPGYRDVRYDAQPAPDDAAGQAVLARLKGRQLPMVDEVQVSMIDEEQPRWLSFLNGQLDALAGAYGSLPGSFAPTAVPNGQLAPHLAKRGIVMQRQVNADVILTLFNMEHPLVGGLAPEKVALRRAIALAMDTEREARQIRRGLAVPAQSVMLPHGSGYDPQFKSENGDHDPARARALLEVYGYRDRDGDGYREQPDGQPLVLEMSTQPDQIYRQFDEQFQRDMQAVGLRVRFLTGQWPEQLKQARAGKLMLWMLGNTASSPDGQDVLQRLYGPMAGGQNLARFRLPAFDALYARLSALPDGPEREALFQQARLLSVAYMPYKASVHRISVDLLHPWVIGYRRPLFWNDWWHRVDLDAAARQAAGINPAHAP